MRLKTRIFELNHYQNLSELARAMGISVSQVYRVQNGKRSINQKFIIGAMRAFPKLTLEDLFYIDSAQSVPAGGNTTEQK